MQSTRKRRAQVEASPSPTPTRRRVSGPEPDLASSEEENFNEDDPDGDITGGADNQGQMVKKLVRLALASEYSRNPIRRTDINAKVMAPNTGRQFKYIFEEAQHQLHKVFGMTLTELPQKEKITISQKRAMQRSQGGTSTKSYVLTSTLPATYRVPAIMTPSRIPSTAAEAAYTALYTFIISVILLSPRGMIPENRLERHLKRVNADNYAMGGEKTEKILKRMEREQYIIKVRERDGGGEESVDFVVGPRGKVEVGERGVAGVVRKVYGKKDMEAEELEKKLVRSLGDVVLEKKSRPASEEGENEEEDTAAAVAENRAVNGVRGGRSTRRSSGRTNGRGQNAANDDDEEEEAEDEGEDSDD